MLKSDPMWPEVPDEQTWIWTNDQKSTFEFLPQTPAAAAEITGVAASGFGFCRSQIPMVLQSMTQSAQSAVNMANITPWAHELRDTEADTMEEPSRDKLNKVGQVATPTHMMPLVWTQMTSGDLASGSTGRF